MVLGGLKGVKSGLKGGLSGLGSLGGAGKALKKADNAGSIGKKASRGGKQASRGSKYVSKYAGLAKKMRRVGGAAALVTGACGVLTMWDHYSNKHENAVSDCIMDCMPEGWGTFPRDEKGNYVCRVNRLVEGGEDPAQPNDADKGFYTDVSEGEVRRLEEDEIVYKSKDHEDVKCNGVEDTPCGEGCEDAFCSATSNVAMRSDGTPMTTGERCEAFCIERCQECVVPVEANIADDAVDGVLDRISDAIPNGIKDLWNLVGDMVFWGGLVFFALLLLYLLYSASSRVRGRGSASPPPPAMARVPVKATIVQPTRAIVQPTVVAQAI